MYVLEHATSDTFFGGPGRLTNVAPNGTRNVITTALSRPTGVVMGDDHLIQAGDISFKQLLAEIRSAVDQKAFTTTFYQD
jgi:hypothetical protein